MAIVTTTYRYKPPPKRNGRKLAEITGPGVVTAKGSRRPVGIGEATAAELEENENARPPAGDIQPSTPPATTAAPELRPNVDAVGDRHCAEASVVAQRRA